MCVFIVIHKVNLGSSKKLGTLYKVRVWTDADDEEDERETAWFLQKVKYHMLSFTM